MPRLGKWSRLFLVLGLILTALEWSPLDIKRFIGFPFGVYGFNSTGSVVTRVDPGGPADRAGVRVGDRIALGSSTQLSRYAVVRGLAWSPGDRLTGTVTGANGTRAVSLVAVEEPLSDRLFVALRFALAFLTIGIAAALLLSRPEPATWGFFLYCLTVINLPGATSNYVIPPAWLAASTYLFWAMLNLSGVGGVLFALAFAGQPIAGWRWAALGATIAAAVVATAADVGSLAGVLTSQLFQHTDDVYTAIVLVFMLVGLVDSYRHDVGASRQRLRWMIAALIVAVPARYISGWFYPGPLSYGQYASLIAIQAVLPLAASYAMFRRRVIDINFVVSRTLVYGALTALLIGAFSLLDAVVSRAFAESRVNLSIDIVVALLLGFSLNSAHRQVDALMDRILFRQRHKAEQQIERGAAGLIHASDEDFISRTLVRLPLEALGLSGVALYRSDGAVFTRSAASGRFSSLADALDRNDSLPLYLMSEHEPVRLESLPLSRLCESRGAAGAVLAVPLTMRGELSGFVVYGAHENGADIDPDEQRALVPLVRNAAIAYDHLETAALRARVARLEAMLLSKAGNEAT